MRVVALLMLFVEETAQNLMCNQETRKRVKFSNLIQATIVVGTTTRNLIASTLWKNLKVGSMLMARRRLPKRQILTTQIA